MNMSSGYAYGYFSCGTDHGTDLPRKILGRPYIIPYNGRKYTVHRAEQLPSTYSCTARAMSRAAAKATV